MLGSIAAGAASPPEQPGSSPPPRHPAAGAAPRVESRKPAGGPYNILFILTDQGDFSPGELPSDYRLPAHERLARGGSSSKPSDQLLRVHAVAIRSLHRPAHPAHQDVRQHEFPMDQQYVHRDSDDRAHASGGGYYTAYKGQVASHEGVRDRQLAGQARDNLHRRDGGLPDSATTSASATSSRTLAADTCTTTSSRRWA